MDDNPCSGCGAVGFHKCPHQEILRRVEETQLREGESRQARDRDLDRLARDFWERVILADVSTAPPEVTAEWADLLTAEWRKRFDPKEGA